MNSTCIAPTDGTLDARLCGAPAITTRVVDGLECALCAAHATEGDDEQMGNSKTIWMSISTHRDDMDPDGVLSDSDFSEYEQAYFEAVADAVRDAYPEAECEFEEDERTSVSADGFGDTRDNDRVEATCRAIAEDVWSAQEFWD